MEGAPANAFLVGVLYLSVSAYETDHKRRKAEGEPSGRPTRGKYKANFSDVFLFRKEPPPAT